MITKFQLFESTNNTSPDGKFKKGDRVVINLSNLTDEELNSLNIITNVCKDKLYGIFDFYRDDQYGYVVNLSPEYINGRDHTICVNKSEIRQLNPKEKEKFDLEDNVNKFNL